MSLQMMHEALRILGLSESQSNTSFVAMSPMQTNEIVESSAKAAESKASSMYSSNFGLYFLFSHSASFKYDSARLITY